jgi:hypothetical protein
MLKNSLQMLNNSLQMSARSHGVVVKADGSWPRGCGFKTRHRMLYGCKWFASYFINEKLKIKVAKWGAPKKYLKKNSLQMLKNRVQILIIWVQQGQNNKRNIFCQKS